jgi:hypothetical protein
MSQNVSSHLVEAAKPQRTIGSLVEEDAGTCESNPTEPAQRIRFVAARGVALYVVNRKLCLCHHCLVAYCDGNKCLAAEVAVEVHRLTARHSLCVPHEELCTTKEPFKVDTPPY